MGTVITFTAASFDVITITGDGVYLGYTYDKLIDWQGIDDVELGFLARPNAPGAFAPEQTFPGEKVISVEGQCYMTDRASAIQSREDLTALYNSGKPVTMTVTDDLRATSRLVYVKAVRFPWTVHKEFAFTIDVEAPDPRRYGTAVTVTTLLASPGSGLEFPIEFPIDFGTAPIDGRVTVANPGNAETVSTFTVSGGEMLDGFAVVNVDTGERLTYLGPVTAGTSVVLDSSTRTAYINGTAPAGRFLASPQWWSSPPKSSRSIQFLALGAVTGAPRLDITTAPAYY